MSSNEFPCPVRDGIDNNLMSRVRSERRVFCDHPLAGGRFILEISGAHLLPSLRLTEWQKANLSYWIYQHNLRYRLLDKFSRVREEDLVVLDWEWVEHNRNRTPLTSDRLLAFLRELIRCDDANERINEDLLLAAGGCRHDTDRWELEKHAAERGWIGNQQEDRFVNLRTLNLAARIHVDEQLGEVGRGRQGFVAMWFDPRMKEAYSCGIEPAIRDVGYEPVRIDRKEFLGKVDDEIVAEIRRSRFVVADFTTSKKSGARGGVYYEAGFAQGLGIDVIYTCRKDRMKAVHFDTNHFNHITWKKPKDLREKLRHRIEATLGRGPLDPSTERSGRDGEALK